MATARKMSRLIDRIEKSWPLPFASNRHFKHFGEQWRLGRNGINEGMMTVKRAHSPQHKRDYLSVAEEEEWGRGSGREAGLMPGTSNWAGVEHEAQAVGPCPLPSIGGL